MVTEFLNFLASPTGEKVVKWVMSTGLGLVICFVLIYNLTANQTRLEAKIDKQALKIDQQNDQILQMGRFQTDTLLVTLRQTNAILQDFKNRRR